MKTLLWILLFVIIQSEMTGQEIQNNLPVIKLPFGCISLKNYKYTKGFEVHDEEDSIISEQENLYTKIEKCYYILNYSKNYLLPKFEKFEIIKIGNDKERKLDSIYENFDLDSILKYNENLIYTKDSFQYKLPNFGNLECYYSFHFTNDHPNLKNNFTNCFSAGNLIFYNPDTRTAKIINIYTHIIKGIDYLNFKRFFYIEKNKKILIYEGVSYDGYKNLKYQYTISISKNNEILITKMN